jgi:hypothetical protein
MGVGLLLQALTKVASIKDYDGASGNITFENQMADKEIFIKTVKGGDFVILD